MPTATADPTDIDLSDLTYDELMAFDPTEAGAVQAIEAQIEDLKPEASANEDDLTERRQALSEAEDALQETRVQRELGEATKDDLQEAEEDVEAARDALQDAREDATQETTSAQREAIERLKARREEAIEAARKAAAERAIELRDAAAKEAYDAYAEAVQKAAKVDRLRQHANAHLADGRRKLLSNTWSVPAPIDPRKHETIQVLKRGEDFGADSAVEVRREYT
jgi:chromosome segregation ATPase